MSPPTPAWHAEAKRLHAEGMSLPDIAKRFAKSDHMVRIVLNINGALERRRAHNRARLAALFDGQRPHRGRAQPKAEPEVKPPRPIAGEPDPRVMAAARAFAAGQIDRAEMMRRLRD